MKILDKCTEEVAGSSPVDRAVFYDLVKFHKYNISQVVSIQSVSIDYLGIPLSDEIAKRYNVFQRHNPPYVHSAFAN